MLAVLRWANNLRDRVAGFRVAQLLPGIGPGSAAKLLDAMAASGRCVRKPSRAFQATRAAAAEHWQEFVETISTLHLERGGLAGRTRPRLPLVRAAYGTAL